MTEPAWSYPHGGSYHVAGETRQQFCERHKRGKLSANFRVGEVLRCPRQVTKGRRVRTCGGSLGFAPHGFRAVVRAILGLGHREDAVAEHRTCGSCRGMVEVLLIRASLEHPDVS